MRRTSWRATWVRSTVMAVLAVSFSTFAHVAAGGHTPDGRTLVVLTAVLSYAVLPLTRGRLSVGRATAVLAVFQLVVHVTHTLLAVHPAAVALAVPDAHSHGAHLVPGGGAHVAADVALMPSPTMTAAHLAAAVVVGVALTRGEAATALAWAAFVGTRSAVLRWVEACLGAAALLAGHRPAPLVSFFLHSRRRRRCTPRSVWLAPAAARRGPPALLGA